MQLNAQEFSNLDTVYVIRRSRSTSSLIDYNKGRTKIYKSNMNPETLRERVAQVVMKRETLLRLLEQPNLGILRTDVNQALEEMDDLIDEYRRTFPNEAQFS